MFTPIGRRLALLNAFVVIVVIALVGLVTYLALRRSLDAEMDNVLRARVEQVARSWEDGRIAEPVLSIEGHEEEDERERGEEILREGDTIVFVVDPSRRVVFNPRGIVPEGILVEPGIERALAGHEDSRSVTIAGVGGMRVLTAPIRHDDQIVGAVQALRSLREHQRELELVRWMTLLGVGLGAVVAVPAGLYLAHQAMRPINAAFERERSFIADASHELRTPLTVIRANAEFAMQDPSLSVGDIQQELGAILEEVDRTDRLVDDLLTLAKLDAGQLPLRRAPHDLGALAGKAAESMRLLAAEQGVELKVSASGPCRVTVDADRMIQVVRILVDNAIKHTPAGGLVEIATGCAGNEARVTVRDTGVGIPPEHIPRVFDRFYRIDKARSRTYGGTGLGLAIAKAIVEAHGGRIWLESQVGAGTTVTMVLPTEARAGPGERSSAGETMRTAGRSARSRLTHRP